jgi:hypothetical protein
MPAPVPSSRVRFHLYLDDLSYPLPEGVDTDALTQQVADAIRTNNLLRVDIEDPAGHPIQALVNPARARIAYVAPQARLGVGTPGH